MADARDDADERLAAAAVTLLTLVVAFGGLALDAPFWWVAFPVGFGGLLPLTVALARRRRTSAAERARSADRSDALEELRSRYARGEIDEAEFERRVERLLETETDAAAVAHAERWARERTANGPTARDATTERTDAGTERER
jgi:uncharacterized membrane protein